jgi:hypothetical protein
MSKKQKLKELDITPTWLSLLPVMKGCIEDRAMKGMSDVNMWGQIEKGFKALDQFIAQQNDQNRDGRVPVVFEEKEFEIVCMLIHSSQNYDLIDESVDDEDLPQEYLDTFNHMQDQLPTFNWETLKLEPKK